MVEKNLKQVATANRTIYVDEDDSVHSTGVAVDHEAYGNGTFVDRDYDTRFAKSFAATLRNIGANSVDYKILAATKNFNQIDADLTDGDFTEELVAEAAIAIAVKPTGSVQITAGTSGSVDTVTVDGVDLIDAAIPFNTSIDQTATDLATAINAKTTVPNYSAVDVTDTVTITEENFVASTKVVASTVTATITTTDVNMSGGATGKTAPYSHDGTVLQFTAVKIRAKETAAGSPGIIVADVITT